MKAKTIEVLEESTEQKLHVGVGNDFSDMQQRHRQQEQQSRQTGFHVNENLLCVKGHYPRSEPTE